MTGRVLRVPELSPTSPDVLTLFFISRHVGLCVRGANIVGQHCRSTLSAVVGSSALSAAKMTTEIVGQHCVADNDGS